MAPRTKFCFGLFDGEKQIGFCAFTDYCFNKNTELHSNRVVIHPDYVGFGLGMQMVDVASEHVAMKGYRVTAKFTSVAMLKNRLKNPRWKCIERKKIGSKNNQIGNSSTISEEEKGRRDKGKLLYVTYYKFLYISDRDRKISEMMARKKAKEMAPD